MEQEFSDPRSQGRIIKVRLPNSFQKISSADGYRLIICCNRKYRTITLLNVYPKRGKQGRLDQLPGEYKRQLQDYADEFKAGTLVRHDIDNNLQVI